MPEGGWGWSGVGNRALKFPNGQSVAVSQNGRARLRYNNTTKQLEVSIDGGPYMSLTTAASGALAQAAWFVDAINGNDTNNGATAATALKTLNEYTNRIGTEPVSVPQTLTLLSDISENVAFRGDYPLGLTIQGTRTVLRSSTLTAVTAWVGSTFTEGGVTDSSLSDWTADIGDAIVMTAGASVGGLGWIASDLGGGDAARFSPMWDAVGFDVVNPTTDTYDIVSLATITGTVVFAHVGSISANDIHFNNTGFTGAIDVRSGFVALTHCKITSAGGDEISGAVKPWCVINGCNIGAPFLSIRSSTLVKASMLTKLVSAISRLVFAGDSLVQGVSDPIIVLGGGAVEVRSGDFLAVFDMPSAGDIALNLQVGASGYVRGYVFGDGNDGAGAIGLHVDAGATLAYEGDAADRFGLAGSTLVEANISGTTTDYATLSTTGLTVAARLAGIVPADFL